MKLVGWEDWKRNFGISIDRFFLSRRATAVTENLTKIVSFLPAPRRSRFLPQKVRSMEGLQVALGD